MPIHFFLCPWEPPLLMPTQTLQYVCRFMSTTGVNEKCLYIFETSICAWPNSISAQHWKGLLSQPTWLVLQCPLHLSSQLLKARLLLPPTHSRVPLIYWCLNSSAVHAFPPFLPSLGNTHIYAVYTASLIRSCWAVEQSSVNIPARFGERLAEIVRQSAILGWAAGHF